MNRNVFKNRTLYNTMVTTIFPDNVRYSSEAFDTLIFLSAPMSSIRYDLNQTLTLTWKS